MENFEEILTQEFLGNPVQRWLIALTVFICTYIVLRFLRRVIRKRAKSVPLVSILLTKTRKIFLAFLAFYIGCQFVRLGTKLEPLMGKSMVLMFLYQASIWGTQTIEFYLNTHLKKRASQDASLATSISLLGFLARLVLFTMVALVALHNIGVDITALVAGLGVGGIAIALAVQNILGDLFASLTIVLDKPFVIGDTIQVGDYTGTIENIGLKTTRIRSVTGEQMIFANSDLLQSRIRNFQRLTERRISMMIGVTYETPLEKLKKIPQWIEEIVKASPQTRFDQAHLVKLGDYALQFNVVYWVTHKDAGVSLDAQQAVHFGLLEKFAHEKVEFAYPTSVQYAKKADGTV